MSMKLPAITAVTHRLATIPADDNQIELGAATSLFDINPLGAYVDANACPR